ncbi:MAG: radical SAM protein [Candidatus Gracilibacteria bacterium]|nr:radical SAM protein [Candidatus Gracilibacteria bacterium]
MRRNNVLDIYITEVCNLNCEYCYVDIKKVESDGVNSNEFIEKVSLLDYDNIRFLGGEPLIKFNEIKDIINSVKSKNNKIQFSIITNGILLNEEKLNYFKLNSVSIAVSLHDEVLKKFRDENFLKILLKYKDNIGFILLIKYTKEKLTTKIFILLSNMGFKNFSISPITSDEWNNLENLENEIKIIINHIFNNSHINISEASWTYLKNLNIDKFCTREQVDKKGDNKLCNRFSSEDFLSKGTNISKIRKLFNEVNNCSNCEDRWFCVCPFGWYIDNFGNKIENNEIKIKNFHKLNKAFIKFYKEISNIRGNKNFLTKNIDEIRFNLTNQCNLRCDYCYLKFDNEKLDLSVGKNIIDYYLEQEGNNKIISFFGGEPLLEFKLLEELVEYANIKSKFLNKNISFKIATNLILLNDKIIDFLLINNFDLHISFNGKGNINDITRDNSTKILLSKIDLLKSKNFNFEKIVILNVIFPHTISYIGENLTYFELLGFKNINFEIYLGNKYIWTRTDINSLYDEFKKQKNLGILDKLNIINYISSLNKYTFLDISTSGKISENSLIFFNDNIDFSPKLELNNIFKNL